MSDGTEIKSDSGTDHDDDDDQSYAKTECAKCGNEICDGTSAWCDECQDGFDASNIQYQKRQRMQRQHLGLPWNSCLWCRQQRVSSEFCHDCFQLNEIPSDSHVREQRLKRSQQHSILRQMASINQTLYILQTVLQTTDKHAEPEVIRTEMCKLHEQLLYLLSVQANKWTFMWVPPLGATLLIRYRVRGRFAYYRHIENCGSCGFVGGLSVRTRVDIFTGHSRALHKQCVICSPFLS